MATLKFDQIASDFVARIPTTFKSAFTPGGGIMPATYVLPAANITNYVNRALQKFFNDYWAAFAGDFEKFIKMFPELVKLSASVALTNGNHTIINPHLDYFKLINGLLVTGSTFVKLWGSEKYTIALTEEYDEYTATADSPAIMEIQGVLSIFPQSTESNIKFLYVKMPVDKTSGLFLTQNGSQDSPFYSHWHKQIADIAYLMFLEETNQTA